MPMMLDISRFFDMDEATYKDKEVVVYKFKDGLLDEFVSEFVMPFRQAYISDEELDEGIAEEIWGDREEGSKMKIPTLPHLKSGEFAEILLFFLSQCLRCTDVNVAPLKWRWKENQDTPCHLTDIVLAKCDDEKNPSKEDYLYFVESKAKAIPLPQTTSASVMNDAIDGAVNDCVSRAGKTVAWLVTKLAHDKKYDMARKIGRFKDSTDVEYQRFLNAAIVVDKDSLDKHIANITAANLKTAKKNRISLFAVPFADMKALYERVFNEAVKV